VGYKYFLKKMPKLNILIIAVVLSVITVIVGKIICDNYSNSRYKRIFIESESNLNSADLSQKLTAASGVVPHHLVAEEIMEDFFSALSKTENLETIILLSPDHFNSGDLTEKKSFLTLSQNTENFGGVKVDNFLLQSLENKGKNRFAFNSSFITSDHGITNLLPFVKRYFPKAKILPILIPESINEEEIKSLTENINSLSSSQIIIASVDFSHYLPKSAADFHDLKSARTLVNFDKEDFENLEVDCWQCLYAARLFAELREMESPQIIAHKNSADFLKAGDKEETTSYFSVIFKKDSPIDKKLFTSRTILFVGDIMLDREVENLIKKNGVLYPFQKVSQFTKGVDFVSGNLEGPIVENPPNFSIDSLIFAFSKDTIEGLLFGNFNLLSLANNHTLNMRENGLTETRNFLGETNINFIGDPLKCSWDFSHKENNLTFLAFNKTYFYGCLDEEITETIKSARSSNPENFIIVNMHWGNEYKLKSSALQQKLAYEIIDAGADLIIGHHPHVVQEIGIYKNKLIFYSLGNFVFDQYFSKNTQQGLAVGLEVYPFQKAPQNLFANKAKAARRKLVFRLFPLQSELSQPALMPLEDAKKFLERLAEKSDQSLFKEIKSGIIKIER
jgi:poly-gamma-glutamate synthesis protein (capsule biosynthesis protein)